MCGQKEEKHVVKNQKLGSHSHILGVPKKSACREHLGKKKTKSRNANLADREHFGKKTKVGMQTKTKKFTGERMQEMETKPNNISRGCGREKKQK
jgi:hypothetical protein